MELWTLSPSACRHGSHRSRGALCACAEWRQRKGEVFSVERAEAAGARVPQPSVAARWGTGGRAHAGGRGTNTRRECGVGLPTLGGAQAPGGVRRGGCQRQEGVRRRVANAGRGTGAKRGRGEGGADSGWGCDEGGADARMVKRPVIMS